MNNSETVIDPLGNEVMLPKNFYDLATLGVDVLEVYDKPSKVIESPAMIMQVRGAADENYYFRSVGWENTLLLGTKKIEGRWMVHKVFKNPCGKHLRDIYLDADHVNLIEYKSF